MLVISWEKHLRTWCTDLVWLRRILLLEDTSIEQQNSSCRKCDLTSWDVKSISYGTYLILSKNKKYVAGEETRPFRGETHLAKKKIRIQRDMRNKSPSEKNDMHFVRNEKKRHSRKTGNEISCEKRETRHILWKMGHLKKCMAFHEKPGGWHWES